MLRDPPAHCARRCDEAARSEQDRQSVTSTAGSVMPCRATDLCVVVIMMNRTNA